MLFFLQTGWCWCVNRKTGAHLTGTSVRNGRPNCDASILTSFTAHSNSREWKKCPSKQRENFKIRLMDYLRHVMRQATNSSSTSSQLSIRYRQIQTAIPLEDEKVAKWHFTQLDRNNNGVSVIKHFSYLFLHFVHSCDNFLSELSKFFLLHIYFNFEDVFWKTG